MVLFLSINSFIRPIIPLNKRFITKSFTGCRSLSAQTADRPFTLPSGEYRPKQSLGQNFLSDQNTVMKIVNAFSCDSGVSNGGNRVIELGPGPGAITRKLYEKYPSMSAVEIDQRSIAFLGEKLPGINVIHMDVLDCNWELMSKERGGKLSIIGNLPFYITSQILFSLADAHQSISQAVVTMQLEVAERIIAKPRTKSYGILSVAFQLYGKPKFNFKIPNTVFYPVPKVDAALITIDFNTQHPDLNTVDNDLLRTVIITAFGKRRKMLRASLKELLLKYDLTMPEKWTQRRPEELLPVEFIELTKDIFGDVHSSQAFKIDKHEDAQKYVWRKVRKNKVVEE